MKQNKKREKPVIFLIYTPSCFILPSPSSASLQILVQVGCTTRERQVICFWVNNPVNTNLQSFQSSLSNQHLLTYKMLSTLYNILWVSLWAQAVVSFVPAYKKFTSVEQLYKVSMSCRYSDYCKGFKGKNQLLCIKNFFKAKRLGLQTRKPQFGPFWFYTSVPLYQ